MAEVLELPGKKLDLSTVKGMSDEEYDGLIVYVKQWDDPKTQEWLDTVAKARGTKAETAPATAAAGDPNAVPDGTVSDVLEWVGDDPNRAQAAYDVEADKDDPRSTLVEALEGIINS